MCFIKNSCLGSPALLGNDPFSTESLPSFPAQKDPIHSCSSLDICPSFTSIPHFLTADGPLLQSLLSAVHINSNLLLKLQQVHAAPLRTSPSPRKCSNRPPKKQRTPSCGKKEVKVPRREELGLPKNRSFKNCLERNSINTD